MVIVRHGGRAKRDRGGIMLLRMIEELGVATLPGLSYVVLALIMM